MTTAVAGRNPAPAPHETGEELSHKEILQVMTGLLAALFTALISSTIVSTALPTIMADLHGTQRQYTWVITASLLAMTISTPIMGKLADLFNKKLLIQLSILIFVAGSVGAGFATEIWQMMLFRALQGIGMGGLTSLTQAIMGTVIAPRQRGRYAGYMGAVMAVATVSGPLLGGVITDNLNWRWCFFVCVPLAVIALLLLQKTLKLPALPARRVRIDGWGAFFLAIAAATPMLWVTFAGKDYDWISLESLGFLGVFVLAAAVAVVIELRHSEPIVPIRVLRNRTTALMILTGISVGVAMFGTGTFMTQYFQLAGGHSPTVAGLMTIPMILAQLLSSVIVGQLVTRTGRWKPFMVFGSVLLMVGLAGLGMTDHDTEYWFFAIAMAVTGIGVGCLVQNIVLAVQNTVDVKDIGASSATIAFFRSLGGAVGVSILGAVLANEVQDHVVSAVQKLGGGGGNLSGGSDLDIGSLPEPIRTIVRDAYGDSFGVIFLIAAAVSIAAFIAILFVKEVPLRTTVAMKKDPTPADAGAAQAALEGPAAADQEPAAADQEPALAVSTSIGNGVNRPVPVSQREPATDAGTGATELDWDPGELDDPTQRMSVAALDVLAAAQDQVRAQEATRQQKLEDVLALLDQVAHDVDATAGGFHRRLQEIRDQVQNSDTGDAPAPDGVGGDKLRQYEYNLLLDSQQTAERVIRLARADAERTLAEADQQRRELEKRIEQLRKVERELTEQLAGRLDPTTEESPDARGTDPRGADHTAG